MSANDKDVDGLVRYDDLFVLIKRARQRMSELDNRLFAITKLAEADLLINKFASAIEIEVRSIATEVPELLEWIAPSCVPKSHNMKDASNFKGKHDDAVLSIVQEQGTAGITPHFITKLSKDRGKHIVDASARKSLNRLKSLGFVIDRNGRWFSVPIEDMRE